MKNNYFRLFANIIVTKGAIRSTLNNLHKEQITFIPNDMADIIEKYKGYSIKTICKDFGARDKKTILAYFNWLSEKGYGFWCESREEYDRFPELIKQWDMPFPITNMIIDSDGDVERDHNYADICAQVAELGVPYLQFRFFTVRGITFLKSLMEKFVTSRVKHIEILLQYSIDISLDEIYTLIRENCRIARIVFYAAPTNLTDHKALDGLTPIIFTSKNIDGELAYFDGH